MTRAERDDLRRDIDAARRDQLASKPSRPLVIAEYGNWSPQRTAAGKRALAALREATRRDHERRTS